MCAREPDILFTAVAVVKSDAALGGTSLASVPCGSGSLHPAYCASSRLKFSNRAMVVDARARTCGLRTKYFREWFRIREIREIKDRKI